MADTFERVKEIVLHARELSVERRAAYLTEVCGEDAALRGEVQALLDHEGADVSVLSPGGAARFITPDVAAALDGAASAAPRRDWPVPNWGGARRRRDGHCVPRRTAAAAPP
jgi:hypothetical protein